MLLEKETFEKFGYKIDGLGECSNKPILLICDYCGCIVESSPKRRKIANRITQNDCCNGKCKYIKMKSNNLSKHGVENAFQRKDVKNKIKETVREKYGVDSWVQSKEFKEKSKTTNLEKYGVVNPMDSPELRQRQQDAVKAKYGVDNVSKVKKFQEKRKETCLVKFGNEFFMSSDIGRKSLNEGVMKKYGVENVFQSEEIKDKIKESNQLKYNVDYPMQSQEIREKSRITNLEKYGFSYASQSEEVKYKIRETSLEKYGFEHATQSQLVKDATIKTNYEKYGVKFATQLPEIQDKILNTKIKKGIIKVFDGKSMEQIAKEKDIPYSTFVKNVRTHGIDFAMSMEPHENVLEKQMSNILDSIPINYTEHNIINKRKTDFVIEDKKIIVEVNGNFWHSDCVLDKKYHQIKRQNYLDAGYRTLFFMENEVENKSNIVKSILCNTLGISQKIFARKCDKSIVDKKTGNQFLQDNHLMGKGSGIMYGLFYNNELISILQVKSKKGSDYEISRFCSKLNYSIVGGFSSLLSFFEKEINPDSVKTYIDLRYGNGIYLPKFGFKYEKEFLSFKWTNGAEVFNRMKFPKNSGYEKGLYKIWDCGQAKYVKTY